METSKLQEEINISVREFGKLKRGLSNKKIVNLAEIRIKNLLRNPEYKNYLKKNPDKAKAVLRIYKKYLPEKTREEFKRLYT